MDPQVSKYLRGIGRRGGKKSRRQLSSDDARQMVRLREARRAYRVFHTRCFWSFDPGYVVTAKDIPWVVEHLRAHGARPGWDKAAQLCRE
jgi:hypothetical protein